MHDLFKKKKTIVFSLPLSGDRIGFEKQLCVY